MSRKGWTTEVIRGAAVKQQNLRRVEETPEWQAAYAAYAELIREDIDYDDPDAMYAARVIAAARIRDVETAFRP